LVFILIALVQSTLASTEFKHAFAPTGPFVPAREQQCRHDVYLNGFWQFQLVALPENFHEGVDPAPELRLPAPSAWATVPVKAPSPWNVNSFADLRSLGVISAPIPAIPQRGNQWKWGGCAGRSGFPRTGREIGFCCTSRLSRVMCEPNVPKLDLTLKSKDAVALFLSGKSVFARAGGDKNAVASGLPLRQGWNHFLVRLVHGSGDDTFSAKFTSSGPAFLDLLHSALQRP
jgi:hypothetical protein